MEQKEIFKLALLVRSKIDECKEEGYFNDFPNGFCAISCIWLYKFLSHQGLTQIEIRQNDNFILGYPHTWLHWNNLDIDITSDQFSKAHPKVYVKDASITYKKERLVLIDNLRSSEYLKAIQNDNKFYDGVNALFNKLNIIIE